MNGNEKYIAIYSRKSKFTGKGESIGNQIELCKEYIQTHYTEIPQDHILVYEDEGFSGGNLNRPDFKKMMEAARRVSSKRSLSTAWTESAGISVTFPALLKNCQDWTLLSYLSENSLIPELPWDGP